MSVNVRIISVELETDFGTVRYNFSGPLTVLSGPVGVGKSTLFEAIKYAVGGRARLAPVVRDRVKRVRLLMQIADRRIELARHVGNDSKYVEAIDVHTGARMGHLPIQATKTGSQTVSDFLMDAMSLPTDIFSTSKTRANRITFNSIWSFMYVEQREIDRSIAHNTDNYAEASRKATFELLFGLTDISILALRKAVLEAQQAVDRSIEEERVVADFLLTSRTSTRVEVEETLQQQLKRKHDAQRDLDGLHQEAESVRGEVGVVRDLVLQSREELAQLQFDYQALELVREENRRLAARLHTRENEIARANQATNLLAPIDFVMCPRCAQSLKGRKGDEGFCTLCLQPDPPPDSLLERRSEYEMQRLAAQIDEVETLLTSAEKNLVTLAKSQEVARTNLSKLESLLDERTRYFVSPRLEQYADASAEIAGAEARIASMEAILRQWDRAADLAAARLSAEHNLDSTRRELLDSENALAETRTRLMNALSADYEEMVVTKLGVPSATSAYIDDKTYLPYVNGHRFDKLSTGGITTALVTAYWVTVLATALRERETNYPTLLIIDSPRKSIGSQNARLVDQIYRQLDVLAQTYGDRMQVIVADNDIPPDISKRWQDMRFDYDNPTISTVQHPGLAGVTTLDQIEDDA